MQFRNFSNVFSSIEKKKLGEVSSDTNSFQWKYNGKIFTVKNRTEENGNCHVNCHLTAEKDGLIFIQEKFPICWSNSLYSPVEAGQYFFELVTKNVWFDLVFLLLPYKEYCSLFFKLEHSAKLNLTIKEVEFDVIFESGSQQKIGIKYHNKKLKNWKFESFDDTVKKKIVQYILTKVTDFTEDRLKDRERQKEERLIHKQLVDCLEKCHLQSEMSFPKVAFYLNDNSPEKMQQLIDFVNQLYPAKS